MFSWLKRKTKKADGGHAAVLYEEIRSALKSDDDDQVRIVGSVAALLLCLAYADGEYSGEEEQLLSDTLGRIRGLDASGVQAITKILREHTVTIAAREATTYARELLDLTADDFRRQLLHVLLDLAASDDEITVAETNMLRAVTRSLGLSQADFNTAQRRHRDKLSVLK